MSRVMVGEVGGREEGRGMEGVGEKEIVRHVPTPAVEEDGRRVAVRGEGGVGGEGGEGGEGGKEGKGGKEAMGGARAEWRGGRRTRSRRRRVRNEIRMVTSAVNSLESSLVSSLVRSLRAVVGEQQDPLLACKLACLQPSSFPRVRLCPRYLFNPSML